jgi:hypothetical protein
MERRHLLQSSANVRLVERADKPAAIAGYAAVYYDGSAETEYWLWEDVVERVMPGAFADVLSDDVRGLFNHDVNLVLGRLSAGTLSVRTDARGLAYEIEPPDTQAGRDVPELLRRGDVTGSSFSFAIAEQAWREEKRGTLRVMIREIVLLERLYDVGPVTFPAYDGTTAQSSRRSTPGGAESSGSAPGGAESARSDWTPGEWRATSAADVAGLREQADAQRRAADLILIRAAACRRESIQ